MLSSLISLLVFGFVALVMVSVALAVVGVMFGLAVGVASFLLFKVAPILLIGWLVLKLVSRSRAPKRISASDQRWLDS